MQLTPVVLIVSLVLNLNATAVTTDSTGEHLYQKGVQLLEQGEVEKALSLWMGARSRLEKPDVRIGFRFIETVAGRELEKYYRIADIMYHWGLQAKLNSRNRTFFKEELERLTPLAEQDVRKQWKNYREENTALLGRAIAEFWESLDPTPLTNYNERLIEHWRRLAHIKEHFTQTAQRFEEADARAEVYLKFGRPDANRSGVLTFDTAQINNLISQVRGLGLDVERRVETSARSVHSDYHYKIWIYNDIRTQAGEVLVFTFGNRTGDEAPYRKFNGAADFIPTRAYSRKDFRRPVTLNNSGDRPPEFPFTVGTLLHVMYLSQLSAKADIFAKRYEALRSEFDNAQTITVDGGVVIGQGASRLYGSGGRYESKKEKSEFKKRESAAPPEKSRDADLIPEIDSRLMQRRFLNEEGQTYTYLFTQSSLGSAIKVDLNHNNRANTNKDKAVGTGNYIVKHGVIVKNTDKEVIQREVVEALPFNRQRGTSLEVLATSVFKLNYKPVKMSQITFSAELHNNNSDTQPLVETPFPSSLRGLENKTLEPIEPLRANRTELSDVVLGYNLHEDRDLDRDSELKFPFTLSYDNTIPRGKSLVFYLEAYNLPQKAEVFETDLTYKVVSRQDNLASKLFGKRDNEQTSITMKLKSDQPTYKNVVEVETDLYEAGEYKLILILNPNSDKEQQVKREVKFTIE